MWWDECEPLFLKVARSVVRYDKNLRALGNDVVSEGVGVGGSLPQLGNVTKMDIILRFVAILHQISAYSDKFYDKNTAVGFYFIIIMHRRTVRNGRYAYGRLVENTNTALAQPPTV